VTHQCLIVSCSCICTLNAFNARCMNEHECKHFVFPALLILSVVAAKGHAFIFYRDYVSIRKAPLPTGWVSSIAMVPNTGPFQNRNREGVRPYFYNANEAKPSSTWLVNRATCPH